MKILVVDDHALFRISFIRFLSSISKAKDKYDEASNGLEALEKLQKSIFDLIFLDVSMPLMDGYETCKLIRSHYPTASIIILTQFDEPAMIKFFFRLGVCSILSKNDSAVEVEMALMNARLGKSFFPPRIGKIIKEKLNNENRKHFEFTPQEKKLIHLLYRGMTSKNIAQAMSLTVRTVRTYRERLLKKTSTRNVAELLSFGFSMGILKQEHVGKSRH